MKILVAEPDGFSPRALAILKELGPVTLEKLTGDALREAAADYEILWVRLRNRIGAELLDNAPRLRWIVTPTTGLNHIDLESARRRGVGVLSLRGEVDFLREIRATAELTIGLMLCLLRRIPAAAQSVIGGVWNRDVLRGRELYGLDVGLIGFGRLGRIVAGYLLALGSRVRFCDPAVREPAMPGVERMPLEEVLARSQMVSLHASSERGNENFFNADCFSLMPRNSWFVNTARGELVDEEALLAALESGRLAGAALDVLTGETGLDPGRHRLIEFARRSDRLILTPHIGGCTHESMERTEVFLAGKLKETLQCAGS